MLKQIKELLETPDAFREWLQSKEVYEIVGYARECECCPIWMFLSDKLRTTNFKVARTTVTVFENYQKYSAFLPTWAQNFVLNVDESFREVRAGKALKLLNEVAH